MSNKIFDVAKPGVVTGDDVQKVFEIAKKNEFAIPAVNVVGSNSVNAVIEAARDVNSPVIIQFSNGGGVFFAGKGLSNEDQKAAIAMPWPTLMVFLLFSILIMQPRNCCLGSMVCWMPEKSILKLMESLCSAPICWTSVRNH